MPRYRYAESELVGDLDRLPGSLRAAFAAACAERLLPAYAAFVEHTGEGDYQKIAATASRLWEDLVGHEMSPGELQAALEGCMAVMCSEEESFPNERAFEDGAAAVAFALRARMTGSSQEAAWAASRATEVLCD